LLQRVLLSNYLLKLEFFPYFQDGDLSIDCLERLQIYNQNLFIIVQGKPAIWIIEMVVKLIPAIAIVLVLVFPLTSKSNADEKAEAPNGWQSIFNGRDLTGWDGDPRL
jgi:hypothetical protein